jgi:hypothetical protein
MEQARELIVVFAQLKVRHATAQKHLQMRLMDGKPVPWAESEAVPEWIQDELPDGTTTDMIRNRKIRAEFESRKKGGENSKDIRSDLADKYGRSESTIKDIVYSG